MLRGMDRVLCSVLGHRVRQRQQPVVCATELSGGGLKRWPVHAREDGQSRAICALPVRVGVAVESRFFCGCRADGFGDRRVGDIRGVSLLRLVGGNRAQGRSHIYFLQKYTTT